MHPTATLNSTARAKQQQCCCSNVPLCCAVLAVLSLRRPAQGHSCYKPAAENFNLSQKWQQFHSKPPTHKLLSKRRRKKRCFLHLLKGVLLKVLDSFMKIAPYIIFADLECWKVQRKWRPMQRTGFKIAWFNHCQCQNKNVGILSSRPMMLYYYLFFSIYLTFVRVWWQGNVKCTLKCILYVIIYSSWMDAHPEDDHLGESNKISK